MCRLFGESETGLPEEERLVAVVDDLELGCGEREWVAP